ncbi:MAG: site-specific DNA-methyltransferase [Acidobacteria bacterium]|nr:site-specific DNA-methyltransferase [Acidobacteriota bacterium]
MNSRAPRNRTLTLTESDLKQLRKRIQVIKRPALLADCVGRTIHGDALAVLPLLLATSVDLLIVDPPYNLTKTYNDSTFSQQAWAEYESWVNEWLALIVPLLKPAASVYVCSEWRSSGAVQRALENHFIIKNRITWEREKGRGALRNWKNCSEDIWFCVRNEDYFFNVEAVKQKRRVIAPYRDSDGKPKDWQEVADGGFRVTHPSNLWTDISVPFWSMPENTDHPTQKPEKLIAKLMLASSQPGDVVLDPFAGSGTTAVVAKKLGRQFIAIEREELYCLYAEKRLEMAESEPAIQGYSGGHFWERNTLAFQDVKKPAGAAANHQSQLFEPST